MDEAERIDLHASGESYVVGGEIEGIWIISESLIGIAIKLLVDGIYKHIGYRGDYTVFWVTPKKGEDSCVPSIFQQLFRE